MSLLFSDIYVSKMEKKLLIYEDDMYIPREKNEPDSLFEKLNSYHANTILTIEKNPTKFLGTKIIWRGCEIETEVYNKSKKVPVQKYSKIPTRFTGNS